MGLLELFLTAVGLSMDAFAVSICKGLSAPKIHSKHMIMTGLYFGIFQAFMPAIGYFFGSYFQTYIINIDHWIAFALLTIIGVNMIRQTYDKEEQPIKDSFDLKTMLPLAVATSIDALAVGVTFAFLQVDLFPAVGFIGTITFALSAVGIKIGHVFGIRFKTVSELCGGVVLVLIGLKMLLEHIGMLG